MLFQVFSFQVLIFLLTVFLDVEYSSDERWLLESVKDIHAVASRYGTAAITMFYSFLCDCKAGTVSLLSLVLRVLGHFVKDTQRVGAAFASS